MNKRKKLIQLGVVSFLIFSLAGATILVSRLTQTRQKAAEQVIGTYVFGRLTEVERGGERTLRLDVKARQATLPASVFDIRVQYDDRLFRSTDALLEPENGISREYESHQATSEPHQKEFRIVGGVLNPGQVPTGRELPLFHIYLPISAGASGQAEIKIDVKLAECNPAQCSQISTYGREVLSLTYNLTPQVTVTPTAPAGTVTPTPGGDISVYLEPSTGTITGTENLAVRVKARIGSRRLAAGEVSLSLPTSLDLVGIEAEDSRLVLEQLISPNRGWIVKVKNFDQAVPDPAQWPTGEFTLFKINLRRGAGIADCEGSLNVSSVKLSGINSLTDRTQWNWQSGALLGHYNLQPCGVATPTPTITGAVTPTPTPQACNNVAHSGSQGVDEREWEMGMSQGFFTFEYDAAGIPDRFIVSYEGQTLLDTGSISGSGSRVVVYGPGSTTKIGVRVEAPEDQTFWEYQIKCPATGTPTPGSQTPTPTPTGTGPAPVVNFHVKFEGVTYNIGTQRVKVKAVNRGVVHEYPNVQVVSDSEGVLSGSVTLSGMPADSDYLLFIKGPKHSAMKFCENNQTQPCAGNKRLTLATGGNDFNFTGYRLLAGDVPAASGQQDGLVNLADFVQLKQALTTTDTAMKDRCNLDFNKDSSGRDIIDGRDMTIFLTTLATRWDDDDY